MATEPSWYDDDFNTDDAADDALSGDFEAIPAGEYEVELVDIEEKQIDNDRATGLGLNIQFKVHGPSHENRRLFKWFNVAYETKLSSDEAKKKAATTQRIGRGQYGAMCVAMGVSKRPPYEELIGKFALAKVVQKEDTYRGETKVKNEIKSFKESQQFANASRPTADDEDSPWG